MWPIFLLIQANNHTIVLHQSCRGRKGELNVSLKHVFFYNKILVEASETLFINVVK